MVLGYYLIGWIPALFDVQHPFSQTATPSATHTVAIWAYVFGNRSEFFTSLKTLVIMHSNKWKYKMMKGKPKYLHY